MPSTLLNNEVLRAFDAVAEVFDAEFENSITRRLRNRIYAEIEDLLPRRGSILDMNCGTGIDMLHLLEKGFRVAGNDLSPSMIEQARAKVKQRFPEAQFWNTSFESLDRLASKRFDLVLSNFGGLNCVSDLRPVVQQIGAVLSPGGFFVGIVMPPISLWEIVAGLARGNPRSAFRRFRRTAQATGFKGKTFSVSYHSFSAFLSAFRPWFTLKRASAMSVLSPPPHAVRFKQKYHRLSRWLEQGDTMLASLPILRSIGDHFLVVLQKTSP